MTAYSIDGEPSAHSVFTESPDSLYSREGLLRLDERFLAWLHEREATLAEQLVAARRSAPERKAESALWLAVAPWFDEFVGDLFGIEDEIGALRRRQGDLAVIFDVRRRFVHRRVLKRAQVDAGESIDGIAALRAVEALLGETFSELGFARALAEWLGRESESQTELEAATRLSIWAIASAAGRRHFHHGVLFTLPAKRDPFARFAVQTVIRQGLPWLAASTAASPGRQRQGFALSDAGADLAQALGQIDYCIYCHNQGKDSCSTGLKTPSGEFQKNAIGATQDGCPLGERISEMHEAKQRGYVLAALAIACVDNPMIAGTGHRICNDCMVACIYQKQNRDPVNVPQAETRLLRDVLDLPWGFEIYSLLTRWNPFHFERPMPRAASGRSVLVVGLGSAGYTLAHHLLNDGHSVVAIDGLKVEPLPPGIAARDPDGRIVPFELVRDIKTLTVPLDERVSAGFGGVAEYGITVRWDKNFLTMLRLLLERRADFSLYGGVRFGGALTTESAFAMGFDHIALCTGAGRPTILGLRNGLAPGVRQASDFLMALQLTGAGRADSLANLQIRLPVVVIGGGLTAIDTCTEALAYYPVQIDKFLLRHDALCERHGEARVRAAWTPAEREIADEFLAHARELRAARRAAMLIGEEPDVAGLLRRWGGARVVYRRSMAASPAYRNHEEIESALGEGIEFGEDLWPLAVEVDSSGHASGLRVRREGGDAQMVIPARTILVAAGTVPNTVVAREQPGFRLDGKFFQAVGEDGTPLTPDRSPKPRSTDVIVRLEDDGRAVTFFGDLHPSYAGKVVSAMASAKNGYPVVSRLLARISPHADAARLAARLREQLPATVVWVERLGRNIVEVVVHAPLAARAFKPGQFFRLQNFEARAPMAHGTRMAMEGLALTGAWVDAERGEVGLITLEMGGSSSLFHVFAPGEPVVLMGPTGEPTHIARDETVLLAGGGLGNAVLFSIGRAFRAAGSRVLYFAGYRHGMDVFKRREIEGAADIIVWCSENSPAPAALRPGDRSFVGNIVDAMRAYAEGRLGPAPIRFQDIDRMIAIGSDGMMAAVAAARHGELASYLKRGHVALASINSPMQCMMKEICAQCLQTHRDPATGEETVVFTCYAQDQPMDHVVFPVLRDRLRQNSMQEKLTAHWIAHCRSPAPRA